MVSPAEDGKAQVVMQLPCARIWWSVAFAAKVALAIFACGGSGPQQPKLAAAASTEAQKQLRDLEARWEVASPVQRRELRSELSTFIADHGSDPSVARARILLAQIAMVEGRLGTAEEIIQPVLRGDAGRTRDEARVIHAAILHRRGQHDEALAILEPLEGKLLTAEARQEYSRTRVMAALSARRWRLAMAAMTTWIHEADDRREEARDWVRRSIDQFPTPALSRMLADWERGERNKEAADWLRKVIIDYLTGQALEKRDAHLARDLLEHAPTWLRASEAGEELALLAAQAQEEAQISGHTVGVVVGGNTADERRRSTQVALGLVQGFQQAEGDAPSIKLLAEDERDSITTALATLMGNGASALVAGVSPDTALLALTFAESRKVPIVVMSDPGSVADKGWHYGFVFGESETTQANAMRTATQFLGSGSPAQWVFVGSAQLSCEPALSRPGVPLFPVGSWYENQVGAVGVLGDASCARRVARELAARSDPLPVVLGLEAAAGPLPEIETLWSLQAGRFPQKRHRRSSNHFTEEENDKSSPAVGWYDVLGRDVARLMGAAMSSLPETTVRDPAAVRKRHDEVRDALARAKTQLVSTNAPGFAGGSRVQRELTLEAVSQQ